MQQETAEVVKEISEEHLEIVTYLKTARRKD